MPAFPPPRRTADTLVFVPTYNEAGTIGALVERVLALPVRADVLVVDDGSTDGTLGVLAQAAADPRVGVIRRPGKLGLGSAHKLAWLHARRHGYARLVTLDADLSHDPADIPRLLAALDDGAEVAIGSRFAPGGRLDYRGWRRLLSRTANALARGMLRLPIREFTTSLRAARLDRVPAGLVETIGADGYAFFLVCVVRLARQGLAIAEIPIHFRDRSHGVSKIPRLEILRGAKNLLRLAANRRAADFAPLLGPDESRCPACEGPYRVMVAGSRPECLACAGHGRSS